MTEERMALIDLVEKQADGDLVREMPAFAAERIMEAEVEARRNGTSRKTVNPPRGSALPQAGITFKPDPRMGAGQGRGR